MKGIAITECRVCPHRLSTNHWSSDSWDRMEDWECGLIPTPEDEKHKHKKIRGAVEWHEESKISQPDWCPLPDINKPKWEEAGPGPRGDMDPESWGDPPDWRPREMGQ